MKLLQFITHPLFLITSFLLIIISGESFANIYLFYILIALPHGGIHAVLAFLGLGLLIFSYAKYQNNYNYLIEPILNITGAMLLILSSVTFFCNDIEHYNYGTFRESVPLFTLIVFTAAALFFLIKNFIKVSTRRIST